MLLTIHNRALLRGMVAGAVALVGVSGCSRSDRAAAGRDTAQSGAAITPADTQATTATQPAETAAARARNTHRDVSGYRAMGQDTSATPGTGDSARVSADAPEVARASVDTSMQAGERLEPSAAAQPANADTLAKNRESDRMRPPEDSSETVGQVTTDSSKMAAADTAAGAGAPTDTTAAGYEPMARDTSTVLAQGDTSAQVQTGTTVQTEADTAAIRARLDTTAEVPTQVAIESEPDTVTVVGDSSSVDKPGPRAKEDTISQKADSLAKYHEAERVRPPKDSTETLGGEAVGAAQVQSTGNIVTGADAVALMTREGQPCRVEDSRDVQWDLASSPATLNPCGTGTMTLPKVQTGEEK